MRVKLLLGILLISSVFTAAQAQKTKLVINTSSSACFIFVDGKLESRGKLEISLPKGEYYICVKESILKWTGKEVTDRIKITGTEASVEKYYNLGKEILLNSEPQNARVYSRDSLLGYTPLFLDSGIKNATLIKDNYGARNINLSGSTKEIDLGTPVNGTSKGFVKSVWFKVLLGTTAILGATAAYYKIQADKRYDDYSANKSSSTLNEVNRLDTISGIALGALQINFGVLIYLLLSE